MIKQTAAALTFTLGLSAIGALGDYFLKHASRQPRPLETGCFVLGFTLYASTAVGWVFVMRHLKLGTIGAVYCVATVLLLVGIGTLFGERLTNRELAGIALALTSLFLLGRFA